MHYDRHLENRGMWKFSCVYRALWSVHETLLFKGSFECV